jgi:hypothetical protein
MQFGPVEDSDGSDGCADRSTALCTRDAQRSNHFLPRSISLLHELEICLEARGAVGANLRTAHATWSNGQTVPMYEICDKLVVATSSGIGK